MFYSSLENAQKVLSLMQQAAALHMMPQFGKLTAGQIQVKADQSLVTEVDHAVEDFLTAQLAALLPGSVVLGEEGFAADAGRAQLLLQSQPVWVVDPLDGTRNFANGKNGWGILVAYVEQGEVRMVVAFEPVTDKHFIVLRGQGVFVDGQKFALPAAHTSLQDMQVYIDENVRHNYQEKFRYFGGFDEERSMSIEIALTILEGKLDVVLCSGTNPWDDLPAILLLEETGGRAAKLPGGEAYRGAELLTVKKRALWVRNAVQWQDVHDTLFAGVTADGVHCL